MRDGMRWMARLSEWDPVPGFPLLRGVSEEVRLTPAYRWAGAQRTDTHWLFQYTLSGEGMFRDGSGQYRVRAGEGFMCEVTNPAVVYGYPPEGREPYHLLFLTFTGALAAELFTHWVARHGPVAALAPEGSFVQAMRKWEGRGYTRVETGQGLGVLTDLFQSLARYQHTASSLGRDRTSQALKLMRVHLCDNWLVEQFAETLGVSREQLTRDMVRFTGEPPFQTYRRMRLDAAAMALVDSARPIRAIAHEYGWPSAAHFSRVFRRQTGYSPSHCRAMGALPLVR